MIAISLWQPWASAIAVGLKTIETRGWAARCVGSRIAIHAAKRNTPDQRAWWMHNVKGCGDIVDLNAHAFHENGIHDWTDLPFGAVVCTAQLTDVLPTVHLVNRGRVPEGGLEHCWGNYQEFDTDSERPRFGWLLSDIERLATPAPAKGWQNFFTWDPATNITVGLAPSWKGAE